jgi:hypothetical protein
MVYNTQNYWVFGLFHRPVFWRLENTKFLKLDLFLSSGEGGKTPTLSGPLERANLNHFLRDPSE